MEEIKGISRPDGYTKAGLFGLPFCIIGYPFRGEVIYLFAGGFFADLLGSPLPSCSAAGAQIGGEHVRRL